jgi:hypothetical protein
MTLKACLLAIYLAVVAIMVAWLTMTFLLAVGHVLASEKTAFFALAVAFVLGIGVGNILREDDFA